MPQLIFNNLNFSNTVIILYIVRAAQRERKETRYMCERVFVLWSDTIYCIISKETRYMCERVFVLWSDTIYCIISVPSS